MAISTKSDDDTGYVWMKKNMSGWTNSFGGCPKTALTFLVDELLETNSSTWISEEFQDGCIRAYVEKIES